MPVYRLIGTKWSAAEKIVASSDPDNCLIKVLPAISKKLNVPSMKQYTCYATNADKKPCMELKTDVPLDQQGLKQGDYIYVALTADNVLVKFGTALSVAPSTPVEPTAASVSAPTPAVEPEPVKVQNEEPPTAPVSTLPPPPPPLANKAPPPPPLAKVPLPLKTVVPPPVATVKADDEMAPAEPSAPASKLPPPPPLANKAPPPPPLAKVPLPLKTVVPPPVAVVKADDGQGEVERASSGSPPLPNRNAINEAILARFSSASLEVARSPPPTSSIGLRPPARQTAAAPPTFMVVEEREPLRRIESQRNKRPVTVESLVANVRLPGVKSALAALLNTMLAEEPGDALKFLAAKRTASQPDSTSPSARAGLRRVESMAPKLVPRVKSAPQLGRSASPTTRRGPATAEDLVAKLDTASHPRLSATLLQMTRRVLHEAPEDPVRSLARGGMASPTLSKSSAAQRSVVYADVPRLERRNSTPLTSPRGPPASAMGHHHHHHNNHVHFSDNGIHAHHVHFAADPSAYGTQQQTLRPYHDVFVDSQGHFASIPRMQSFEQPAMHLQHGNTTPHHVHFAGRPTVVAVPSHLNQDHHVQFLTQSPVVQRESDHHHHVAFVERPTSPKESSAPSAAPALAVTHRLPGSVDDQIGIPRPPTPPMQHSSSGRLTSPGADQVAASRVARFPADAEPAMGSRGPMARVPGSLDDLVGVERPPTPPKHQSSSRLTSPQLHSAPSPQHHSFPEERPTHFNLRGGDSAASSVDRHSSRSRSPARGADQGAHSAVAVSLSASPRDLLGLPQHRVGSSSPRGAAVPTPSRVARRLAAPSNEVLQRYENAADPHRVENSFVATYPRAISTPSPVQDTPSPQMIEALQAAVRREVRDSMAATGRGATPEVAVRDRELVNHKLEAAQRVRQSLEAERRSLEEELSGWTRYDEERARAAQLVHDEEQRRVSLQRELDAVRSQQAAKEHAVREQQLHEIETVQREAKAKVEAAMAIVAARDAAIAQRNASLDAMLSQSASNHRARHVYQAADPADITANERLSAQLAQPVVPDRGPIATGPDVELMRQRLVLADVRRQSELARHELRRSEMEHHFVPDSISRAVNDTSNMTTFSTPHRASHHTDSSLSFRVPSHFTPVTPQAAAGHYSRSQQQPSVRLSPAIHFTPGY